MANTEASGRDGQQGVGEIQRLRDDLCSAIGLMEGVRVHQDGMLTQESVAEVVDVVLTVFDRPHYAGAFHAVGCHALHDPNSSPCPTRHG